MVIGYFKNKKTVYFKRVYPDNLLHQKTEEYDSIPPLFIFYKNLVFIKKKYHNSVLTKKTSESETYPSSHIVFKILDLYVAVADVNVPINSRNASFRRILPH